MQDQGHAHLPFLEIQVMFATLLLLISLQEASGCTTGNIHMVKCVTSVTQRHFPSTKPLIISFSNSKTTTKDYDTFTITLINKLDSLMQWPLRLASPDDKSVKNNFNNRFNKDKNNIILLQGLSANGIIIDLRDQLRRLMKSLYWDPTGLFLVAVHGRCYPNTSGTILVQGVLSEMWRQRIMHVVVLVPSCAIVEGAQVTPPEVSYEFANLQSLVIPPKFSDIEHLNLNGNVLKVTDINAYSWFPYKKESKCGEYVDVILLDKWVVKEQRFLQNTDLFPLQITKDFYGCTFKISSFEAGPYVIKPYYSTDSHNVTRLLFKDGLDIRLLNEVSVRRNFTTNFLPIPPNNERWGQQTKIGTWTGIIGNVIYNLADIAITGIMMSFERLDHLVITESYLKEGVIWVVPKAKQVPSWKSLIKIFPATLWILILLAYLLGSHVLWFLAKFNPSGREKENHFKNLLDNLFSVWGIILEKPANVKPRATPLRIFLIFWIFYSIQVNTAYQSLLISVLSEPGYEYQISSSEEILGSGMQYGFHPNLDRFYMDSSPMSKRILSERKPCYDVEYCLDKIIQTDNFAVLHTRNNIKYVVANKYLDKFGNPVILPLTSNILSFDLGIYMKRGCILLNTFNAFISRGRESGLILKWVSDIETATKKRGTKLSKSEDKAIVLTLSHLKGVFEFLCLGLMLSGILYMIEHVKFKLK